jgi:hypothetical protein
VTKRGSHKTAPNVFTEKGFTPEHREQFQSILNSWHDQLCAGIANARKMTSPEEVAKHFSEGPFLGFNFFSLSLYFLSSSFYISLFLSLFLFSECFMSNSCTIQNLE